MSGSGRTGSRRLQHILAEYARDAANKDRMRDGRDYSLVTCSRRCFQEGSKYAERLYSREDQRGSDPSSGSYALALLPATWDGAEQNRVKRGIIVYLVRTGVLNLSLLF